MKRIFFDIIIMVVIVSTVAFVYQTYGNQIKSFIFGDQPLTMYVKSVPLSVTVADELAEHRQGLSGVQSLGDFEGMLFVYPKEDYYNMWMKDMFIPLDIIWINNEMEIVHIEGNVTPDTYPDTYTSPEPARFVLEVNAFFAENNTLQIGDTVLLPPTAVPQDLIQILQ